MGVFDREIKIISGVPKIIDETIKKTVQANSFVIKNYNVLKQLDEKGESSTGSKLKPQYTNAYKRVRIKRGLQVSYVDTHFSGKFHASFQIIAEDDQFKITYGVEYGKYVVKRYGEEMIGIQTRYLKDFVEKYLIIELKKAIDGYFTKS